MFRNISLFSAFILAGCNFAGGDSKPNSFSLLDCNVAECIAVSDWNSEFDSAAVFPAAKSREEFHFHMEAENEDDEVGPEDIGTLICDVDFSQWDYATFKLHGRVVKSSEPILYGLMSYTADGTPNGNIALQYLEAPEWRTYNATIPINAGTECIRVISVLTSGEHDVHVLTPTLALFKNDVPLEFPPIDTTNDWYAMKIVMDNIRADSLNASHVEFVRGSIGDSADLLLEALARNADAAELSTIAIQADANADVAYDYLSVMGPYFLDRALARKTLPGLRSVDLAWDWGYTAIASGVAFERTNDPRFGRLVLEQYEKVLSVRDSELGIQDGYVGRSLRVWGEQRPGHPVWWVSVTSAGIVSYPMLTVLSSIEANFEDFDAVYGTGPDAQALKSLYLERGEIYLESFRAIVEDLDEVAVRTEDGGLYYIATGEGGAAEALNHTHPLAAGMVVYNDMRPDPMIAERVDAIGQFFEASLVTLDNGTCVYPYAPSPDMMTDYRGDAENVWKAHITLLFPYEAGRKGVALGDQVSTCLGKTLAENVLNDPADPNSVLWDEPRIPILGLEQAAWRESPSFGMLFLYSDFDARIAPYLMSTISSNPNLFPDGWYNRVMMVGYAARLEPVEAE